MSNDAALDYLNSLGMFGIKLGLDNIHTLLQRVGDPHKSYPIIHVAGTNGKGSVCSFLGQIYTACGYRVGVYTSPHLECFNERIRIGDVLISTATVAYLTAELRTAAAGMQPTFFEFTTAMAMLYFARQKVDLVVLETGMGGRLDATNVVRPALSIITAIGYDHAAYLGNTLADIAAEKGGIIKEGVPVVLAPQERGIEAQLQAIASQRNAPCYRYATDYQVAQVSGDVVTGLRFNIMTPQRVWPEMRSALPGRHQGENLAVALMAVELMERCGMHVVPTEVAAAAAQTRWPGRLEWLGPPNSVALPGRVLLDGAHNEAGMTALLHYLEELEVQSVHWIGGFKHDKAADHMVALLRERTGKFYAVAPPVEEAWSPTELVKIAQSHHLEAEAFSSIEQALLCAVKRCRADEIVLVAGSLFLVAQARRTLNAYVWGT
ncbi:MAG: folylpolyglutamate synthase/dihydrofolate synthase family protein [Desulfuromonadaceae bacterium]|nr:bifunctional folylpolyglutamate synthase/dihydrofolate synthase [Desulfuromonas sp.]MDY0184781.1 folylpolyglutamate synthase/dihydrofolate synthase family protein [Desulfuromonadaceae bacterium]